MAECIIKPFEAFGPVEFDSTEEEVLAALGPPDRRMPPRDSSGARLVYLNPGLKIDFDSAGRCEYVVSLGDCVPILDGIRLDQDLDYIVAALEAKGHRFRPTIPPPDLDPLYIDELGVSIGREPADHKAANTPDCVEAMRRGYPTLIDTDIEIGHKVTQFRDDALETVKSFHELLPNALVQHGLQVAPGEGGPYPEGMMAGVPSQAMALGGWATLKT